MIHQEVIVVPIFDAAIDEVPPLATCGVLLDPRSDHEDFTLTMDVSSG